MGRKPVLVVMAAGMGSRYGGEKQLDPVGSHGQLILDYSLFDARRAGFEEAVFILKPDMEQAFEQNVRGRIAGALKTSCVFQRTDALPEGFDVPAGRVKPWGTAHAVLCAREAVQGPFAVINADDFYGAHAFEAIFQFLQAGRPAGEYAMVSYLLKNTVSDAGSVARGVCEVRDGFLTGITERVRIERKGQSIAFSEDGGLNWSPLAQDTPVSMNLWGFGADFMQALAGGFPSFLREALQSNPLKAEYFLPGVVEKMLDSGQANVRVLESPDKWYGMTYREDKKTVVAAIAAMTDAGTYPDKLW